MKIYCFSGLGADERVFKYMNFGSHELVHVKWIDPKENESLKSYAMRIGDCINQHEPFVLMGLSFGGMLIQELSKVMNPYKTIIISSISGSREKSFRMRMMDRLKLYNYVPEKYFNKPSKIAFRLFGATTEEEKKMLTDILIDSDSNYIRWALNAIGQWSNSVIVPAFRIHGSEDKLFPLKNVNPDFVVNGGGHLMVVSHSKEIEQQILKEIGGD